MTEPLPADDAFFADALRGWSKKQRDVALRLYGLQESVNELAFAFVKSAEVIESAESETLTREELNQKALSQRDNAATLFAAARVIRAESERIEGVSGALLRDARENYE